MSGEASGRLGRSRLLELGACQYCPASPQFRVEGTGLEVISVPAAPLIARFLSSGDDKDSVSGNLGDHSQKSAIQKYRHRTAPYGESIVSKNGRLALQTSKLLMACQGTESNN